MDIDNEKFEKTTGILKALSNPQRLYIAMGLCDNECNVNKIVDKLGIPQSTASSHLARLKSAGVIKGRRNKNEICYKVTDPLSKTLIEHIKSSVM